MKTWVVLPAYNEEKALTPLLDSLVESLKEEQRDFSIIVVDDGSADGTPQLLEDYAKRCPEVTSLRNDPNRGLAETIRRGLFEAVQRAGENDIIITMDADNTHPAGLALRMIRLIREGNDVVIASRYRAGSRVVGVPLNRLVLSWGAAVLFKLLFPIRGVRDYTCGYRAYRAKVIGGLIHKYKNEFISERGFSCMVDILLKLRQSDLIFAEVPLILRYDLKPGLSKMKVLQTILDSLSLLVRRRLGF
ncbi:MAG: glycosyltransferase [Bacteriovoracia bacterium]